MQGKNANFHGRKNTVIRGGLLCQLQDKNPFTDRGEIGKW